MPVKKKATPFKSLPLDFDLQIFLQSSPNITAVPELTRQTIDQYTEDEFQESFHKQVIQQGLPLHISGYENVLDQGLFSPAWLIENSDGEEVEVYDLMKQQRISRPLERYFTDLEFLTNQFYKPDVLPIGQLPGRQYLKDMPCPPAWWQEICKHIPQSLHYLNDGSDSSDAAIAPFAHDLACMLPQKKRADNLMSYIGHEGTFTPTHFATCATISHNLMVEASQDADIIGELRGYSVWFIVSGKDSHAVADYWKNTLGQEIEKRDYLAGVQEWRKAPFPVHVLIQKPGDLVILPPMSAHQVYNRGTRTMKVAWNRTTADTLELAMSENLTRNCLISHSEVDSCKYNCKDIVFSTLKQYSQSLQDPGNNGAHVIKVLSVFARLFVLYQQMIVEETFSKQPASMGQIKGFIISCFHCESYIFNRFLTLEGREDTSSIVSGSSDDTYDVCLECYANGISPPRARLLEWKEQHSFEVLVQYHDAWMQTLRDHGVGLQGHLQPFDIVSSHYGKDSLADICLRRLEKSPRKARKSGSSAKKSLGAVRPPRTSLDAISPTARSRIMSLEHSSPQQVDDSPCRRRKRKIGDPDGSLWGHSTVSTTTPTTQTSSSGVFESDPVFDDTSETLQVSSAPFHGMASSQRYRNRLSGPESSLALGVMRARVEASLRDTVERAIELINASGSRPFTITITPN